MQINREKQLSTLITGLDHLCTWLLLDTRCTWTKHFENMKDQAIQLKEYGFTQEQLNTLSTSIRSVYGGMGSFNDYSPPPMTKERAIWYKDESKPNDPHGDVYNLALQLKVTNSY